ncbi:MAG: 2-oxoacid:acceptor oxidoreductase family protein, partial [Eubacterium sp.]|nr:2-oxoacid:acceptor oxidoreductase family protein [Eubacterium sp.]
VQAFRERAPSPNHPVMRGTAQNPDIYFQTREAANLFYEKIPGIIKEYMAQIEKRTGRTYRFFQYYGAKNPKYVVIAMGSVCETIREILPQMNCADTDCDTGSSGMQDDIMKDNIGIYGMIQVHLFRPFSAEDFLKELPESVERIAVLDRTKEPGALGEPLYLDICGALYGKENAPLVIGGRYGLGSKDTTPAQIAAVFDNLTDVQPKNHFTIGIEDDVTHHSLAVHPDFPIQTPAGLMQCKFWGLGSDGTVGANKQAVKIIGEYAKPYVQGYFSYDYKKSGGLTVSHLRFGDTPIRSEYLIQEADYIACHNESFLNSGYDLTEGLKENGIFVLNTQYGAEQIGGKLPKEMVHALIEKNARLYLIDAGKLAHSLGLGNRINMIMQGAFFHLTGILPQEKALACLKNSIQAAYGKKGADI